MKIFLNHMNLSQSSDIYDPFAYEELLCRRVGEGQVPSGIIHVWSHERAFVLGLRDSRLPNAAQAMDWLESEGYKVMVRNSGGAAVPLDAGVVNVTFIEASEKGSLNISGDFQKMARLLQNSLEPLGVRFKAGEIEGSYCPGEYDLSINGRKFCGIAQRRQMKAFAVQAFVNVAGSSKERAEAVKQFYLRAGGGKSTAGVLDVRHDVMGSITELHPQFPETTVWLEQLMLASEASAFNRFPLTEKRSSEIDKLVSSMKSRYDPRSS